MKHTITVAFKEFKDATRNYWVLSSVSLLVILSVSVMLLGSAPVGEVKSTSFMITIVSLSNLTIYFVPLIALLLSHGSFIAEFEQKTIHLLLTHPISYLDILLGKFFAHTLVVAIAIIIGYGPVGINGLMNGELENFSHFLYLILSSILLGTTFISIAYMISLFVKEHSTAAGMSVIVWVFFVIIYDMILLGLAILGTLNKKIFFSLFFMNPADIHRMINLIDAGNDISKISGIMDSLDNLFVGRGVLFISLLLWTIIPLVCSYFMLKRHAV
ncbi:MAG: ABC transporter permease [Nitrospinota bacterium]